MKTTRTLTDKNTNKRRNLLVKCRKCILHIRHVDADKFLIACRCHCRCRSAYAYAFAERPLDLLNDGQGGTCNTCHTARSTQHRVSLNLRDIFSYLKDNAVCQKWFACQGQRQDLPRVEASGGSRTSQSQFGADAHSSMYSDHSHGSQIELCHRQLRLCEDFSTCDRIICFKIYVLAASYNLQCL